MKNNWRALMVHTCDIQRAEVAVNTSTIRDRRVAKYDTVASSVPCWFEPTGTSYNYGDALGQQAIKSFSVYFNGGTNVVEGDRLKKGSDYYLVKGVRDNSDQGFGVVCDVEKKQYAMQAP